MRLIDADALIKFIENRYDITWEDDYEGGIKDACTDILEEINKMPTIEPQRTGKWIKARYVLTSDPLQYVWNCSECGKSVNGYSAVVLTDYCPQCGSYNGGDKNDQR